VAAGESANVDGMNSTNAMTAEPRTLMAVNASDCTSDALRKTHALQRTSARDASATLAAQATAIVPCFNSLITTPSIQEHRATIDKAISPAG
jgi:hypothetical protein